MAREIECNYLIRPEVWLPPEGGTVVRQSHLARDKGCTVRVRVMGDRGVITVKGRAEGYSQARGRG